MRAEKDPKTGKWLIQYRYTDWQGKRRKSTKRGFKTKREAEEWLRNFLMTQTSDFDMKFDEFLKLYYADMETRLREHTMRTKKYIIELKILPYFGQKRINDIKAADIRNWQNELIKQGYSPTYLKTINNQLSAVFNYAVKYYDLKGNPYAKAGSMGKSKAEEMNFWTKEDEYYQQFQKRNPNLYVFSAHLHMDEATPHLHIDFVPFTTGSKRGLDTRVSLKQALAKQGFKGGSRGDTEWSQWVQSEKEQLSAVMERHGIEWEHKGTHEKHLSVLDYKKQEREKEVVQLEGQILEKKEEFQILSDRVENYDKGIENLKTLEQVLDTSPEYQLPEPQGLMSAKTYKNKLAEPLVQKLKSLVKTALIRYFEAYDSYYRLNITNSNLHRENERLTKTNEKLAGENENLRAENKNYKLLKKAFGSKQMDSLLEQAKAFAVSQRV